MKSVGLVGGLGPESTIDYYRRILAEWEKVAPGSSPRILIDSLDVQVGLRLVATDHAALADYLLDSVNRLARAQVDFVALTANTGHIVFDELAAQSPVPMLSIVESCAEEARRCGLHKLALLGTRFTMEADFYPTVFARHGMEIVAPTADERVQIHGYYVNELLKGTFLIETRDAMRSIVDRIVGDAQVDGVILGGTELPLLLQSSEMSGVPVLDTTALHVAAIVKRLA